MARFKKLNDDLDSILNSNIADWRYVYNEDGSIKFDDNGNAITEANPLAGLTRDERIVAYQDKANRLNAISAVYQRHNRIITTDSDATVSVVDDPDMEDVSTNTGKDIKLNASLIADLDEDSIISLHGVNYHELSHSLFSPRVGSDLGQFATTNKVVKVMNVLEEARAEQLLISKYSATSLFLEASATQYVLNSEPSEWGNQFLGITGRTYLPLELRQHVADKFIEQYGAPLAQELHGIVHAYRNLVFPRDFDKAKELISRLSKIIGTDTEPPEGGVPEWAPNGHATLPTKGRPEGGNAQGKLQEQAPDNGQENLNDNHNEGEHNRPAHGEGGADDTKLDLEQRTSTEDDKAIADLLSDRMNDIKNIKFVKNEIRDTRKAITNSKEFRSTVRKANALEATIPNPIRATYKKFAQELERMVRDSDPNWERRVRSGKLNIRRTMNPDVNAMGEMFDVWNTGNPNTDIEAVVLTDISGSMGYEVHAVSQGAWVIKRAIESIEGSVSVYAFNDESAIIYDRNDKTSANSYKYLYAGGNTNPIRGLIEAERVLDVSPKSVKIMFVLTDGQWWNAKLSNAVIERMNKSGVITCVVYMASPHVMKHLNENISAGQEWAIKELAELKHGAKIFKAITSPKEMVKVAQSIVKETLSGARH